MVLMLERYATNLEEIVEQRTGELMDEKMKTDALLYRLLPLYVIYNKEDKHLLVFLIIRSHNFIQYYAGFVHLLVSKTHHV